jgi:hypothetical protein
MAISVAGTDTFTTSAGQKTTGAQSDTSLVVPAHDGICLLSFHYYVNDGSNVTSVVLGGVTYTAIAAVTTAANNHVSVWWGAATPTGSQTLTWSNENAIASMGVSLVSLSGTATVSPIGSSGTDSDTNGASIVSGMTFTAGDWAMGSYASDVAGIGDGTAHGNTDALAETTLDGLICGVAYRTDTGTIDLDTVSNSFTGLVGFTVKVAAGGSTTLWAQSVM